MPSGGLPDARSNLPSLQRMALDVMAKPIAEFERGRIQELGRREMDQRRPRGRPLWARSGRELFYRAFGGEVIGVKTETAGGRFRTSPSQRSSPADSTRSD
jgi:hypothetical protein